MNWIHRTHLLTIQVGMVAVLISSAAGAIQAATEKKVDTDPVRSRGLTHFHQGDALIEKAIAHTNSILPSQVPRLRGEWAGETTYGSQERVRELVPVYSVASPDTSRSTPAVVPLGCRCVFVDTTALAVWLLAQSSNPDTQLALTDEYVLAFMLLHEVAHIQNGDASGSYENGSFSILNTSASYAKAREEKADEFAARLIRDLIMAKKIDKATQNANWIAMQLTILSWNMQAYRTIEEFGAWVVGKPSVYFDPNYDHPNLAWRILNANHLIQNNENTKALLDAFDEARQRGAHPDPLYHRD